MIFFKIAIKKTSNQRDNAIPIIVQLLVIFLTVILQIFTENLIFKDLRITYLRIIFFIASILWDKKFQN